MSAKVTISYERPEELEKILRQLGPMVSSCRVSSGQKGRYKKAYANIYTRLDDDLARMSLSEFTEIYDRRKKPEKT